MAAETYANSAYSTLASTINGVVTSLAVTTGHGARFPSTGDFRIKIDSELMICTARSSDTLTVTRAAESTSAASHTAGAAVNHVLTRGSLLALLSAATFTGQANFADGTQAAPSIARGADPDTGIWFAAGAIHIGANNEDIVEINGSGAWVKGTNTLSVGPTQAPSGNRFLVSDTNTTANFQLGSIEYAHTGGTGGDVSGLRVILYEQTTANNQSHSAEIHGIWTSGGGAYQRSALTLTAASSVASATGVEHNILRIATLPTAFGVGSAVPIDGAIAIQQGDVEINHFFRAWNAAGALCFDLDKSGHLLAKGNIYSNGLGATALGFLTPSAATGGATYAGIYYTSNQMVLEAFTQGTGWRDVWVGRSGGKLRVGTNDYTIHRAALDAAASADLSLTTSYADVVGATVTLDRIGVWRVTGTFSFNVVGAGDNNVILRGQLACTGGSSSQSGGIVLFNGPTGDWMIGTRTWTVTVTAISVTAKLQAKKDSGSGTTVAALTNTTIGAVWEGEP